MAVKYSTCKFCQSPFIAGSGRNRHCSYQCRFKEIAAPFSGADGCWKWPLTCNVQTGYGQLTVRINGKTKLLSASRLSYEIFKQPIPLGFYICHTCDNRWCFNPSHLFAGTNLDNMRDMKNKGRSKSGAFPPGFDILLCRPKNPVRGGAHGMSKINEATAKAIKDALGGDSMAAIARRLGVTYGIVTSIKYGITWAHV